MTKKMTSKQVDTLDLYSDSLKDFKERVEKLISQYGESAKIALKQEEYSDSYELVIYAEILETDKEYAARIKQEAYYEEQRQKRELEEYKRLQAKFGDNPN